MDINIQNPEYPLPVDRAYVVSIVIKSFKGRKDVDVHLFRPDWDESEMENYDWSKLLGRPLEPGMSMDPVGSRKTLLECFTKEERDRVVDYLKTRYHDRVSSITSRCIDFPIPLGLKPLSEIPEGKDIGKIRFEKIPNYTLPFSVHGLFDLSQHKPIVEEQ